MSALEVKKGLYWVGALDPDLRVFDVVMETEYGTTYNSYILKTEVGNVLFETVKEKHFDSFVNNVNEVCSLDSIAYVVVEHTEPDHAGSIAKILEYSPDAKVIGSQVAINFLKEICNREIPAIVVDDKEEIQIGEHTLLFLSVPFLHWPDSIYTYISTLKTLVSCDSFGCHYSDERVFNDLIDGEFLDAYKYYFDMIMGPFKKHVLYALDQIKDLDIETVCPGHGPVLRTNLDYYFNLYREWSIEAEVIRGDKPIVVNAFVSAYGYTQELAMEINSGIKEIIDADIKLHDMVYDKHDDVLAEMVNADGLLFGTPTVNGDALPPVFNLAMSLNGILHGGKVAAAYGSYGWSGEGPELVTARLNLLRMDTLDPALKVNFKPSSANIEEAREYGRRFGKKLKEHWEAYGTSSSGKTFWRCTVCGEIFEGAMPPMTCSVCGVGSEAFVEADVDIVNYKSTNELQAVIIGSGAAAISAAEAIRARNASARITVISNESTMPYYRPILTEMISEDVSDEDFYLKSKQFYKEKEINLLLSTKVEAINESDKTISLSSGESVSFDKLLIATGGSSFVPPINGSDLKNVFTVRDINDVNDLKEALKSVKRSVTVVGGGVLGLEAACSFSKKGYEVTVIDIASSLLPRQTNSKSSEFIQKLIEKSNIKIITNSVVNEIYGTSDGVQGLVLSDGVDVKSELVIISAGLRPNTTLSEGTSISCDRAIVVNEKMETSSKDIYAAGDCAISNGAYYGIWEPALQQGRVAGANMVGDSLEFTGKLYPATLNAFDTTLVTIGDINNGIVPENVSEIIQSNELESKFSNLIFKDEKLIGATLIGDLSAVAPIISGVQNKVTYQEAIDKKIIK